MRVLGIAFACCAFLAVLNAPAAWSGKPSGITSRPLPEFFTKDASEPLCVFKIELSDAADPRKYFQFVDAAYTDTGHWKRGYTLAGIDYLSFKEFFVISYSQCRIRPFAALLNKYFGSRSNISVSESGERFFVGKVSDLNNLISVPEFWSRYKPAPRLSDCLISVTSDSKGEDKVFAGLVATWRKYRFPIADISRRDTSLYLLFSNYCPQRMSIYDVLLNATDYNGLRLRSFLSRPNGRANVTDYLSRYGGFH